MLLRRLSVCALLLLLAAGCGDDKPKAGATTSSTSSTLLTPPTKTGLVPPASKDSPDQAAVRKTFSAYQAALKAKDGEAAATLLDAETLDAYRTYIIQAQNLKREQLEKLGLVDLIQVLRFRHELTPEELAAAKAPVLFARSVKEGWTSDNAVLSAKVGRITVHGDQADISPADKPFTAAFYFNKEKGQWRYDLVHGHEQLEKALRGMMAASQAKDPLPFAVQIIEKASAKKPFDDKHLEGPPPDMPTPPEGSEAALNPGGGDHEHGEGEGDDHGHDHDHDH